MKPVSEILEKKNPLFHFQMFRQILWSASAKTFLEGGVHVQVVEYSEMWNVA